MTSSFTELRQDPATRNWVIIAPARGQRPDAFQRARRQPESAVSCPFCPGNEAVTPQEIWRHDAPNGDWQVRVIPNKFPVFVGSGSTHRRVTREGFIAMDGVGQHEVVIESPEHSRDLACSDSREVSVVLEAYRARYLALRETDAELIMIFRNHGVSAGTSIAHPHSQIIAAPVVPVEIRHRFDVAMQHYDDLGSCLYLDILERELQDGRRIVLDDPQFVAFQPFASSSPFETWIMPRVHQSTFGAINDDALTSLAQVLRAVLAGLNHVLGDPSYNFVIQSAPPDDERRAYFMWHLRIVPRVATPAGFELGSGMRVNPSLPEETAAVMRKAIFRAVFPTTQQAGTMRGAAHDVPDGPGDQTARGS